MYLIFFRLHFILKNESKYKFLNIDPAMSSFFFVSFSLGKNCFVTVIPHREHLVLPHQPTISAAQLERTVPISLEGWPPATPSTSASSGAHGTNRVLLTTGAPPPLLYPTATANNDDPQLPASSASSPPSLCAGEIDNECLISQ